MNYLIWFYLLSGDDGPREPVVYVFTGPDWLLYLLCLPPLAVLLLFLVDLFFGKPPEDDVW